MTIYTAAITLFLVLDPLGNIPIFLGALRGVDPARRKRVVLREMIIALAVLTVFLFFGNYILTGMQISQPAVSIGGGVVLFIIAVRMIFPQLQARYDGRDSIDGEPLIVPLAVPMIAGPSAMATLILFAAQHPDRRLDWFLSLLIAWAVSLVVLVSAERVSRLLGDRGIAAIERLMGMILVTMAVQMLLSGFDMFLERAA